MNKLFIAIFGLLLVGCESSRQSAALTSEQAKEIAIRLANDKAERLYHCQPFQDGQAARFTQGHWVWSNSRGFGRGDIEAKVELAVDGSTNKVDIDLLVNQMQLQGGSRGF